MRKEEKYTGADVVRRSLLIQWREIKRDIIFFGVFGGIFGFLTFVFAELDRFGFEVSFDIIDGVLADVFSVKVGIFLFCCGLLVSSIRNLLSEGANRCYPCFRSIARHVNNRLVQLVSPLFCFSMGFSISLGALSERNFSDESFVLAVMVALLGVIMVIFSTITTIVERDKSENRRRKCAPLIGFVSLGLLVIILIKGF